MNCQQATELASRQRDMKLSLVQKIRLKFHLKMCVHCKNFNNNIVNLSGSMKSFLNDAPKSQTSKSQTSKSQAVKPQTPEPQTPEPQTPKAPSAHDAEVNEAAAKPASQTPKAGE